MAASRKFVDSEGVTWQVCELAPEPEAGRADGWLYFFARGVTRSLASYPDDWARMDWPALEHLCQRATPPSPRRRAPRAPAPLVADREA